MPKHKHVLNLLPKREEDFVDKALYFLLHYFRYVLIMTQIVVIAVFFLRFRLDQTVIDQEEEFTSRQEIMKYGSPLIKEAQAIAFKEKNITTLLSSQETTQSQISYLFQNIPSDLQLTEFTMDQKSISLSGKTNLIQSVRILVAKLKKDRKFKDVTIDDVTGAPAIGYEFSITILP